MQHVAQDVAQGLAADGIYGDGANLASNPSWHVEDLPWKARQIERILRQNSIAPSSIAELAAVRARSWCSCRKLFRIPIFPDLKLFRLRPSRYADSAKPLASTFT